MGNPPNEAGNPGHGRSVGGCGLVTGGHGLVGRYIAQYLSTCDQWRVRTTSRRADPVFEEVPHLALDLADRSALKAVPWPGDTTHVFFAAYQVVPDSADEARLNLSMLANVLDVLRQAGAPLRHVTLYQGGKAYGAHLGPYRTPARESDPRILGPLFYYDQENLLRTLAAKNEVHFTVLRPDHVCGIAFGAYVNLLHVIAVYAALSRELGQPLRFPGTERAYRSLVQLTDARLLARASEWAANAATARDQIFNVTNGDQIRWCNLWPVIAADFGVNVGDPTGYRLVDAMADKGEVWDDLVRRHHLKTIPLQSMVSWAFANAILGVDHDLVSSTIKIRQAGFADCIDSEQSMLELLAEMRAERLLPPA